jgi:AcrR family transcriptional regulator
MPVDRGHQLQRACAEETHRAILQAARDLFARLGYRDVTTRMVAEASGVKQPLLYYHFGDKEALYLEIVREDAQKTRSTLMQIVARHQDSVEERLCQILRYLHLSRSSSRNIGIFFHELKQEMTPQACGILKDLFHESVVMPIRTLFRDAQQCGSLLALEQGGVSPKLATYLFLSALSRLQIAVELNDDLWQDAQQAGMEKNDPIRALVHALLYGMAPQPSVCNRDDD